MSRLLSQEEVDALLSSFRDAAADLPPGDALPYDLRAPLLLAGARLSLVQAACEKIADEIAEALTVVLVADRPIRAEFTRLVQQPAGTVLSTLAGGEPLGLFVDDAGEPVGGISFQGELALAIVDRLQGGEGSLAAPRTLSAVENRLLEGAFHRLARRLDERCALAPVCSGGLDRDPVFGRLAQRGGMLASAAIRLELGGGEAECRVLMTPLLTQRLVAEVTSSPDRNAPPELLEALRGVPVTVETVITGASLRVTDLHRMRPGHVLQLEVPEHDGMGLRLNGSLLAQGVLRRQEKQRLFEIRQLAPATAGE
jgi:flagellar motor switch protein FliM